MAGADLLARCDHATHHLPAHVTWTANDFEPRQNPEKPIPTVIRESAAGASRPAADGGSTLRARLSVEDNCRAMDHVRCDGTVGATYTVGSDTERITLEVSHAIIAAVGGDGDQITVVGDRPVHDERYAFSTEKIEPLGWDPDWSFEAGLVSRVVESIGIDG